MMRRLFFGLLLALVVLPATPDAQLRLRLRGRPVVAQPPPVEPTDDTEVFFETVTDTGTSGNPLAHVPDVGARWHMDGNTFTITNGSHTLTARAVDWGGRTTDASITVTVDNSGLATPTVVWKDPYTPDHTATATFAVTAVKALTGSPDVASVQFRLDGSNIGSPDATEPYTYSLDTTALTNGPHTLVARGTSSGAVDTDSVPMSFLVTNGSVPTNPGGTDSASPTISITSPANLATVSGLVPITVTAADDNAVRRVLYFVDGRMIGYNSGENSVVHPPFSYDWATPNPVGTFKFAEFRSWASPALNTSGNGQRVTYEMIPSAPMATANAYVETTLRNDGAAASRFWWLRLRIQGSATYYGFGMYPPSVSNDCYIFKVVSGVYTQLANTDCGLDSNQTTNTTVAVKFGVQGSTLTAYAGGVSILTATDASITAAGNCGFGAGAIRNGTDSYDGSLALDDFRCVEYGTGLPTQNFPPTLTLTAPQATGTFNTTASVLTVTGTATPGSGTLQGITWTNAATAQSGSATGLSSWSVAGSAALTVLDDQFTAASSASLDGRTATPIGGVWSELANTTSGANYLTTSASGHVAPFSSSSAGDVRLSYLVTPTVPITGQNYDLSWAFDGLGTGTEAAAAIFGSNASTTDFCAVVTLAPSLSPDLYLVKVVAGTATTLGSANANISIGTTLMLSARGDDVEVFTGGVSRITATDGACDNDNGVGIGAGSFRGISGAATVVSDTFTDTDNTNLTGHTPSTGGTWAEADDTCTTHIEVINQAVHVDANAVNCRIVYTLTPPSPLSSADYTLAWTAIQYDAARPACLVARWLDSSNYYAGCVQGATANPDLKLVKKVAGSWTTLGSADCNPTNGNTFTFALVGTSLSFGKGGACQITVTDASLSATGAPGIGFGNLTGVSTDDIGSNFPMDSFTLVAGAGTGDTVSTSTRFASVTVVDQDAAGSGIPLNNGSNLLTFTATNTVGLTKTAQLTVVRGGADMTSPTATITSPTSNATLAVTNAALVLGGAANDNIAVTAVAWTCASCTPTSGTASGTTAWNIGLALTCSGGGTANTIVVTPADAAMNPGVARTIVVTCTSGDTTDPAITITTNGGSNFSSVTTPVAIVGTASDAGGLYRVTWLCNTGSAGTATGTTAWSASVTLAAGANVCTFTAVDLAGNDATDSITVTLNTTLAITTTTLTSATENVAYARTISATGGTLPYVFDNNAGGSSLGGGACTGLSLTTTSGGGSGTVSGTPTTTGTCNFTAKVTDNVAATDTQALAIVVAAAGAEGPHDYFDNVLVADPSFQAGWSGRPLVGHATATDPYYTSQISAFAAGAARLPTYSPGTDTHPEAQDALKFVIPQWQQQGTSTAMISASSANAWDYISLSSGAFNRNGVGVRVGSEIMVQTQDTRVWQVTNVTTGVNPAVLTLAQPFTYSEDAGTAFVSGFLKRVVLPNVSPAINATYAITVIDATHVSIPVQVSSVTNYTGAQLQFAYDASKVRVRRGQFGTTAASHTAATTAYMSINSLETQWFPGQSGNTHHWAMTNGFKHLLTWDLYLTQEWLGTTLNNYKAFRMDDRGNSYWIEPNIHFSGGIGDANCSMVPATDIGAVQMRVQLGTGGVLPWTTTQNGLLGPGATKNGDTLSPTTARFCYRPSAWTRIWLLLDQRANDYDYFDMWIADENRGPTQIYNNLPLNVRVCETPTPNCNGTAWSEVVNHFKVEMNTSSDAVTRVDGRDLPFYFRNWALLSLPASTTDAAIEAAYIIGKRPVR